MEISHLSVKAQSHPALDLAVFVSRFDGSLSQNPSPENLTSILQIEADSPVHRSDELRTAVRQMLRIGGYKPAGRGKPASEYLVRAAESGYLSSINLPVDACNVVSLHSGLPISVVDLNRATPPFEVRYGRDNEEYVFNASGQVIKIAGLLCLCDADGACANAVKDAQRTKTSDDTRETLSVIWGVKGYEDHTAATTEWYRDLVERAGGTTESVEVVSVD